MQPRRVHLFGIAVALVLTGALLLLTAATAFACPVCMPPSKVTISGPGLSRDLTVTDASLLQALSPITLPGTQDRPSLKTTGPIGVGYEVVRYFDSGTGLPQSYAMLGFDHFRYYPGAAGHPSLILYEGPTSGDTQDMAQALGLSALVGKWYAPTPEEDAALRAMAGLAPAPVPTAVPRPVKAPMGAVSTWPATWWPAAALALGFVVLAGALFALRRQRHRVPSSLSA